MKLLTAYHCYNCKEIFERAPSGICPICTSQQIAALSWAVKSEVERASWLHRIYGAGRRPEYRPLSAERPNLPRSCAASANQLEQKMA